MKVTQGFAPTIKTKYIEQCNWPDGSVSIYVWFVESDLRPGSCTVAIWRIKPKN